MFGELDLGLSLGLNATIMYRAQQTRLVSPLARFESDSKHHLDRFFSAAICSNCLSAAATGSAATAVAAAAGRPLKSRSPWATFQDN